MSSGAAAVAAGAVLLFWALPTTLYCWEGAFDAIRRDSPRWTLAVGFVVLGVVPWAAAVAYGSVMRA